MLERVGATSSPTATDGAGSFKISVVDPVKQDQGGLNPYITYKINTATDRCVCVKIRACVHDVYFTIACKQATSSTPNIK